MGRIRAASIVVCCVVQVLAGFDPCEAGGVREVRAGDRVRLRLLDSSHRRVTVIGTVLASSSDSLVVTPSADAPHEGIAFDAIRSVQVSAGMHGGALNGAAEGLLLGAPLGALLGFATWNSDDDYFGRGAATLGGAMAFGLLGSGLGTLAGASGYHLERWRRARLPGATVGVLPTTDGHLAIVFATRF